MTIGKGTLRLAFAGALAAAAFAPLPASALNILLSNDDGFETANIRALKQKLEDAGHDVLLSGPTQNNSGKGGSMNFLVPVTPLAKATRYGSVAAGAPGVGADPADADSHYVDGTPVMSMLYGLDVLAVQRWSAPPDLVISGPNEGNNLGAINNSSGTMNNALYAINRGLPAIAVSFEGTSSRAWTALEAGAPEYELAAVVVKLVAALEAQRASDGSLLPPGTGLNVNVPEFEPGEADALPFRLSRVGTATDYQPVFFAKLSDSVLAVGFGAGVELPGISFVNAQIPPPAGVIVPIDTRASSELNVMRTHAVSVSVIEGVPQARRSNEDGVKLRLGTLLDLP